MTRCCLCRQVGWASLERTKLPGSGYRCLNYGECADRVKAIVAAHVDLAKMCEWPDATIPER